MSNPWLGIPLADYEGHMKSAAVRQLDVLSELFATALSLCRPSSVAVLGVAGGNGLDRIDGRLTTRTVGLDLNPQYLDEVRRRYAGIPGLELHCVDLAEAVVNLEPVQLVHAALVFEHAGVNRCLENALSLVAAGGSMSVVLQLAGESTESSIVSPFPSILRLTSHFSLVEPSRFCEAIVQRGLRLAHQEQHSLPSGKGFWMGVFNRSESNKKAGPKAGLFV